MQKRKLGDLEVSPLGLGCMGLSHAYGEPVEREAGAALIRGAFEAGYTFFDTAECYGFAADPHHNEKLVGEALAPFRDKIVLATKCGVSFDYSTTPYPLILDARPSVIKSSVEGSLKRLKTDYIDLYYLHRIDHATPIEDVAGAMGELIKEGKIRAWGLSEAGEEQIRAAHAVTPLAVVQNRYSMMYRDYERLFGILEELGVGFVAFSPLANGFLSADFDRASFGAGDYRAVMPQYARENEARNARLLALVGDFARAHKAINSQIALAWLMAKKPFVVPIPGSRKIERVRENMGAAAISLAPAEVAKIDAALENSGMSDVFGAANSNLKGRK